MRLHYSSHPRPPVEMLAVTGLTLCAALARFWALDGKGLSYDEAITAMTSRAAPAEIIRVHWQTTFAHPPVWILSMHFWTGLFGQSPVALRLPSALAGVLAVPLLWRVLKLAWPGASRGERVLRLLSCALVALSPVLVLYGQEARMYALDTLCSLAAVFCLLRLLTETRPGAYRACVGGFILANWAMIGLQYYSVLLVFAEGAICLALSLARRVPWSRWLPAIVVSGVPLLLWGWFSPGFRATVDIVLAPGGKTGGSVPAFLDHIWQDLSFGAIRWQPDQAALGYLLLPLFLVGLYACARHFAGQDGAGSAPLPWGPIFACLVLLPIAASVPFAQSVATRYLLFVSPFLYVIVALGLWQLWRWARPLGLAGLVVAAAVAVLGLGYYYRVYPRSEYREMASYLIAHAAPGDAVALEAPRQHLLAKYYLPAGMAIYPVPEVTLPALWPVTAPPVVPEQVDGYLRSLLAGHDDLWLVLAGEDEVDPGEFVQTYLTAAAYRHDCHDWLNVRLCRFISPERVRPAWSARLDVRFGEEMKLNGTTVSLPEPAGDEPSLLVSLDWEATQKPAADYKVTLRLLDGAGQVIGQEDGFPIGPLLPPSTWNAGDQKPGYMTLPVPAGLPAGEYTLALGLYNPAAPDLVPLSGGPAQAPGMLRLARVRYDGTLHDVVAP